MTEMTNCVGHGPLCILVSLSQMSPLLGSVHALAALRSCRMDRTTKDASAEQRRLVPILCSDLDGH